MIVGTLQMRLFIPEARSLKQKRRVVSSIKDRVRSKFNVSIAELDDQQSRQQAVLGVALVANQRRFAEQVLSKVVNLVGSHPTAQLLDYHLET